MVLDYWNNIFPRVDIEQLRYGLRHLSDFVNLPRRTALFENSFVSSAIQQWNSLPCHLRQCPSLTTFKRELFRLVSSLHARMRNKCSNLKCDLFVNHLSETNLCVYCNVLENANHYLFHCTLFTNEHWNSRSCTQTYQTNLTFYIMHTIHPLFHSFRPTSFLSSSIISFFSLSMLSIVYIFRHLLLYIRYFP